MRNAPGAVRDAIFNYLSTTSHGASVTEITRAVQSSVVGTSASSVRSYLTINEPELFEKPTRGFYRLRSPIALQDNNASAHIETATCGKATLVLQDCLSYLRNLPANSIHAVVTDPPYGATEYSEREVAKLRSRSGGIWRIPPAFDGSPRSPLPRFTVMRESDHNQLTAMFRELGSILVRILVPGANVVVASNPLLSHIVANALADSGLELRGYVARLVMTMRGGDRPKNAHQEFPDVSVMPRSMWEPWIVLRKKLDGRVQDNLRRWGTGGFRRISSEKPFGDVVSCRPASKKERSIAPHPSLKPQALMRHIVRAALPLGTGKILDPFAGSGSTLAAANACGYDSLGIERDPQYYAMAKFAIGELSRFQPIDPVSS